MSLIQNFVERSLKTSDGFLSLSFVFMALCTLISMLGAFLMLPLFQTEGLFILKLGIVLSPLIFIFALAWADDYATPGDNRKMGVFFLVWGVLSLSLGSSIAIIINNYGIGSTWLYFLMGFGVFTLFAIIGYYTKIDLSKWGNILIIGLVILVITAIVNLFIGSSLMDTIISCAVIIVFSGLTMYDVQQIKDHYNRTLTGAMMGAISLYLNVLNLFVAITNLFED